MGFVWFSKDEGLGRLVTEIMGSNSARGMDVCPHVSAFGLITRPKSPAKCLNKITKPSVWGGQGPYKDFGATDDYDDDNTDTFFPCTVNNNHPVRTRSYSNTRLIC
jgi:hypothetical protein